MKEIDYTKLLAEADYHIAEKKQDKEKMLETMNPERKAETEKLAEGIQVLIADILKEVDDTKGCSFECGVFKKYGEPKDLDWKLDDEKFEMVLDFSYSISDDTLSYCGPRGFDHDKKITWPYLEELLRKHNISISRKQARREEKPKNWFGTTYYTDKITITLGRQKNNNKESVTEEKGIQK